MEQTGSGVWFVTVDLFVRAPDREAAIQQVARVIATAVREDAGVRSYRIGTPWEINVWWLGELEQIAQEEAR